MRRLTIVASLVAASQGSTVWAQAAPEQPKIIVDGYGEVKSVPDVATIQYNLRGEGKTSDEAVRAMVASGDQIEKTLQSMDSGAEPRTSEVRVSPARGSACKDREYDREDDQLSTGPCAIDGYVATQNITIRTKAVKDAGTMVGLAARGGAYNVRVENFDLSDPRAAKRQAIAEGLADAQARAAAIAAGSRVTLGPIISISTTAQGGSQDIVITGSRIRQPNLVSLSPVTVNLQAEKITTRANVTVTYAIAR